MSAPRADLGAGFHAWLLPLAMAACRPAAPPTTAPTNATPKPAVSEPAPTMTPEFCDRDQIDLATAMWSAVCAITEDKADALRDAFDPVSVRIAVTLDGSTVDAGKSLHVHARLVAAPGARTPIEVPLFVSDNAPSFSAFAEASGAAEPRALSAELARPVPHDNEARHHARIVLHPDGAAAVDLLVSTTTISEDLSHCAPNMKCAPRIVEDAPLPAGTYTLRLRLPVVAATDLQHTGDTSFTVR